jgi:glycosyltransferase involved in cell wall biosynthesis
VHEIAGGRASFQLRSLAYLWTAARDFDLVFSQEMLRGSLNTTLVGAMRGVPVVTSMALPPVEYFRCRRERRQIGAVRAWLGETAIRTLLTINGKAATACVALGPYLLNVASRYCARTERWFYYGVDVDVFRPATADERLALRKQLGLPLDTFLIILSSRISHEKDPETVLSAVARARAAGLDAIVLNLGGGYQQFLALAESLDLPDASAWVLARPAAHPITELADYIRCADALLQGSLEEGLGLSPLEALACGVPVVATAVGGLMHLQDYATLTPRRDADAMAAAVLAIAADPAGARARAQRGREYVRNAWRRDVAFQSLRNVFTRIARGGAATRESLCSSRM